MLQELETDLQVHNGNRDTPIMRRIKGSNSSFYLTKSRYYSELKSGRNNKEVYRLYSWNDPRAKGMLQMEIGEQPNPKFGNVIMTGNYTPDDSDLNDVQYETRDGKYYFESATRAVKNQETRAVTTKHERHQIDSKTFMQMNEIIPTGAQGKAIYAQDNHIIDGPAGTGKSTTILQKLKVLQETGKPSTLILVKNEKVIHSFRQLLTSLDLGKINIKTAGQFIAEINNGKTDIDPTLLDEARNQFARLRIEIEQSIQITEPTNNRVIKRIQNDQHLKRAINKLHKIIKTKEKDKTDLDELNKQYTQQSKDTRKTAVNEINRSRSRNKKRLIPDTYTSSQELFEINDNEEIKQLEKTVASDTAISDGQKQLKEQIKSRENLANRINSQNNKIVEQTKQITKTRSEIISNLCRKEFIGGLISNQFVTELVSAKLKKKLGKTPTYDYIIIDEAQDVALDKIEVITLFAANSILTGDPAQNESNDGIGSWKNLVHLRKEFMNDEGKLNIYSLTHNFRQTCELGTFSYNYRQHLLGLKSVDLQREYFENQKGFWKPSIHTIGNPKEFTTLLESKVALMNKYFTDAFDIVVLYENEESRERILELTPDNYPVKLISIHDIAGREFPIVIAPLLGNTSKETVYIMISRAQYDLTLTTSGPITNPAINQLISEQYLEHKQ